MRVIATNKRVRFEYFVLEELSAGISLVGSEVKSIRAGKTSINEAYISIRSGEAYIVNMYVKTYDNAGSFIPDERRDRKLLLHKSEILRLYSLVKEKGLTIVPERLTIERGLVKLQLDVCRGKKLFDKRESKKQQDISRDVARELKSARIDY